MFYSPNMLKTFKQCEKKFFYKYIENISMPQNNQIFEKGKKIHALANYYLKGDDITKLEQTLSKEEFDIWQKLKNNEFLRKEYVNSEYNLTCKTDNYFISGRIDALVKDTNNYFILDYKTGTIPENPEFDFQTMVYLLTVKKFFKQAKTVTFVYIDLKNNQNHSVILTDKLQNEYETTLVKICDEIQCNKNRNEYTKNTNNCKHCEYKKICK